MNVFKGKSDIWTGIRSCSSMPHVSSRDRNFFINSFTGTEFFKTRGS
ncbi:unnamed protein product [Schistosoma margrebowiei]|uniref:Uncharacterized protein n=1 Tax=Schistosoma margrebowiei TaxID=48269 RepID=A0A183N2G5_9TREM|nr:unnamed protein product [Schistosoma margrebowiei]